jgi:hypothetical protein
VDTRERDEKIDVLEFQKRKKLQEDLENELSIYLYLSDNQVEISMENKEKEIIEIGVENYVD